MSWRENLNVGKLYLGNKSVPLESYDVAITVGSEAADVINVAVQINDGEGVALTKVGVVDFYLADDSAGATPSTVAPSGGVAIGTDGALIESVANLSGKMVSDATGKVDIDITEVGAKTYYLVLVMPTGGLVVSNAITFV